MIGYNLGVIMGYYSSLVMGYYKGFLMGYYCPVMMGYYGIIEQGCISCGTCSYPELTEDHVLTNAYVKIFRTVTKNAVIKSV